MSGTDKTATYHYRTGGRGMSQHKYNLIAIKAKNGEIPPKPPTMSKREQERQLYGLVAEWFAAGCPKLKKNDEADK